MTAGADLAPVLLGLLEAQTEVYVRVNQPDLCDVTIDGRVDLLHMSTAIINLFNGPLIAANEDHR